MSEPNPSLDTLPTDVLRRVWSFFVTFTPLKCSKVEDQIVDLQSVASTRLICKSFHDAFDFVFGCYAPRLSRPNVLQNASRETTSSMHSVRLIRGVQVHWF